MPLSIGCAANCSAVIALCRFKNAKSGRNKDSVRRRSAETAPARMAGVGGSLVAHRSRNFLAAKRRRRAKRGNRVLFLRDVCFFAAPEYLGICHLQIRSIENLEKVRGPILWESVLEKFDVGRHPHPSKAERVQRRYYPLPCWLSRMKNLRRRQKNCRPLREFLDE